MMAGRTIRRARAPAWAAALALATGLAAAGAAQALPSVVSADQEAERANPGRRVRPVAEEAGWQLDLRATLDRLFGPGRWRKTSGYRTAAQENALRRQGAGTVAAGRLSRHSLGGPERPGAYDVVVDGVSPQSAAVRLQRAGRGLLRVLPEGAHGAQGPHLHVELVSDPGRAQPAASPAAQE